LRDVADRDTHRSPPKAAKTNTTIMVMVVEVSALVALEKDPKVLSCLLKGVSGDDTGSGYPHKVRLGSRT
jgi:hypothetical protein